MSSASESSTTANFALCTQCKGVAGLAHLESPPRHALPRGHVFCAACGASAAAAVAKGSASLCAVATCNQPLVKFDEWPVAYCAHHSERLRLMLAEAVKDQGDCGEVSSAAATNLCNSCGIQAPHPAT